MNSSTGRIGIDLGTSSLKILYVPVSGELQIASSRYNIYSPRHGYAETPTGEWSDALKECMSSLGPIEGPVTIGFSGQMHGIVPCAGGRAIHPAILWSDNRASEYVSCIEVNDAVLFERLMNHPSAGMALFSILWLKDHKPELYNRTEVFLQPKDFVRYLLNGEPATEPSDAGATLLFDFRENRWYSWLLSRLGIDEGKLPPIKNSYSLAAPLPKGKAREFGIPEAAQLRIGGGDTACALLGNGIHNSGIIQLSIGTGAQIVEFVDRLPRYSSVLNTFPAIGNGWYVMSAHLNGGSFLEWVRGILAFEWDELYSELESKEIAEWVSELEDLVFLPYVNGERSPFMNPDLTGSLRGLKSTHNRVHIAIAAMLGSLCALRLGLENMSRNPILATGRSFEHDWWSKLTATVLDRSFYLSTRLNASAWGAALIGAGKNTDFFRRNQDGERGKEIVPDKQSAEAIRKHFARYRGLLL